MRLRRDFLVHGKRDSRILTYRARTLRFGAFFLIGRNPSQAPSGNRGNLRGYRKSDFAGKKIGNREDPAFYRKRTGNREAFGGNGNAEREEGGIRTALRKGWGIRSFSRLTARPEPVSGRKPNRWLSKTASGFPFVSNPVATNHEQQNPSAFTEGFLIVHGWG